MYKSTKKLLKKGGALCYITSNKWMRAGYGEKLRKYLASQVNTHSILDFGMAQNFGEATTYTCIVQLANEANQSKTMSCYAKDDRAAMANPADYFQRYAILQKDLNEKPWVVVSKERQRIKSLVEEQGTPLSEWDIQINYGIKTGFNEAFYITQEQRDSLIKEDPKSAEIIVPLIKGRDIERFGKNWCGEYMINSHNGIRIEGIPPIRVKEAYPAVWQHLSKWESQLKGRQDKGDHWSNLRNCTYINEFAKPKIMYPNMTKFLPFYYDRDDGFYGNQKCFIITSGSESLEYLTAFLNSSLFKCCFRDNFPELLGNTKELSKIFIDILPVKIPLPIEVELFHRLVPIIQFATKLGVSKVLKLIDDLIDACIMECYFGEYMAKRDLLFIEDLVPCIASYDPDFNDAKQRNFLDHLYAALNAKESKIRDRLDRICTDSPELLAVIKEEGKV